MDDYLEANRRRWDELVPHHLSSAYYDIAAFRAGRTSLHPMELEEVGDVRGRKLLHLQCHFGLDTLSWAREGAAVTGVDFSPVAISAARKLAKELEIETRFIEADVCSLPSALEEGFDIVFTSYGVVFWLPDLGAWARSAAHCLVPGGTFYIVEFHPICGIFANGPDISEPIVANPYFPAAEPLRFDEDGSYACPEAALRDKTTFTWTHPLSEVINSLIEAGLRIEFIHEFPFSIEKWFAFMERADDGLFRPVKFDRCIPFLYSIRATKPS